MKDTLIQSLEWRYATKKFDPTKKISSEDLNTLLKSIQLTPSSYGLQPIKVLIIESPQVRQEILPIAWNQSQVVDASHLLVFCHYKRLDATYLEEHTALMAETRNLPLERLDGFKNHVSQSIQGMSTENLNSWTAKQTYIALGQLLLSCALLKIDATPMEGFEKEALNEHLQLSEKNLSASLLCPIGYRHQEDPYLQLKKVRKELKNLFETL